MDFQINRIFCLNPNRIVGPISKSTSAYNIQSNNFGYAFLWRRDENGSNFRCSICTRHWTFSQPLKIGIFSFPSLPSLFLPFAFLFISLPSTPSSSHCQNARFRFPYRVFNMKGRAKKSPFPNLTKLKRNITAYNCLK